MEAQPGAMETHPRAVDAHPGALEAHPEGLCDKKSPREHRCRSGKGKMCQIDLGN